jgi:hypothetical protein
MISPIGGDVPHKVEITVDAKDADHAKRLAIRAFKLGPSEHVVSNGNDDCSAFDFEPHQPELC